MKKHSHAGAWKKDKRKKIAELYPLLQVKPIHFKKEKNQPPTHHPA